jgi:hypothetical protein
MKQWLALALVVAAIFTYFYVSSVRSFSEAEEPNTTADYAARRALADYDDTVTYRQCIETLRGRMYEAGKSLTESQNLFENGYFNDGLYILDKTRASMYETSCDNL